MGKQLLRTALLGCVTAISVLPAAAQTIAVETTVAFETRYVFRGIQYADNSFQPGINLSYGNFYGGAWLNLPVGHDATELSPDTQELDLFVGYSAPINESVSYDIGVTYYTFPEAMSGFFDLFEEDGDGLGSNTVEAYAGLSFSIPLSPTVYVYRDFNFDTFTIEGGVSHSFPLAEKTSFDLGGSLGYVIDDDAGADYLYGSASADISYAISDSGSVALGVRYGGSDIAGGSIVDDRVLGTFQSSGVWGGISFTSSF